MSDNLLKPKIEYIGPTAHHNMPCSVCHKKPAVMTIETGIFTPCWECQNRGWELRLKPMKIRRWRSFRKKSSG